MRPVKRTQCGKRSGDLVGLAHVETDAFDAARDPTVAPNCAEDLPARLGEMETQSRGRCRTTLP